MPRTITLIPESGIQFWPVELDMDTARKQHCWFWEKKDGTYDDGTPRYTLHTLEEDEDTGVLRDTISSFAPPEEEIYELGLKQVLTVWEDQWLPLPFFAIDGQTDNGATKLRRGPANWVRGKLVRLSDHKLICVIAVDTSLQQEVLDKDVPYNAPTPEDSQRQDQFTFTATAQETSWFLNEGWVGEWLEQLLLENRGKNTAKTPLSETPHYCEHYALYLTFLTLLSQGKELPIIHLLDGGQGKIAQKSVDVDLVLDLGNSRSCGILIEEHPGQGVDFSNSYPLVIRDLSRPWIEYDKPFPSRVEFSRPFFGNVLFSRRSGRKKAFVWPSPVRIGFEATILAGTRIGNEGLTGLSSPKRYLWDTRESLQDWRFNNGTDFNTIIDPPVNGPFMAMMTPSGRLLTQAELATGQGFMTQPTFSRSTLFTFLLLEILLQVHLQINAPQNREQRRDKTRKRRLRTVMLTMPPGMPVAEQKLLRERAQAAIDLCWQLEGYANTEKPRLRTELDEATATQIVWLHNEITERLGGNVDEMFRLQGRITPTIRPQPTPPQARPSQAPLSEQATTLEPSPQGASSLDSSDQGHSTSSPSVSPLPASPPITEKAEQAVPSSAYSLRVASIDIGGGTTDLMITTYTLPSGEAIHPHQEFRESFKTAGDDIMEHLITHIVLPEISQTLKKCGVEDPNALLNRVLGQDWGGQSEQERHLRRLFVSTILEPTALALLSDYEQLTDRKTEHLPPFTLQDIINTNQESTKRALSFMQSHAQAAGAEGFDIRHITISTSVRQVEASITHILGPVIADLCEVVWTYDCDVLLISGRPSRLRRVADMIMTAMPVPPHRIISMYHYRVGPHYAFRDARNRIDDPKTTAAVGASLCLQAEGRLQNFVLRTRALRMRSTARFIGRLDKNGQLRERNVWLKNVDLDAPPQSPPPSDPTIPQASPQQISPAAEGFPLHPTVSLSSASWGETSFVVPDFENMTRIGYRQLDIERWPAQPLYTLEFGNFPGFEHIALPLSIKITRRDIDPEREEERKDYSDREQFQVTEVLDRHGEHLHLRIVRLRLQTLAESDGYWRDTGRFTLA
ncbi:virulence factor SrfB [Entomobacter blattae]|uniref:Virulence factor SrfB n=1 Tax=Entomobacter blattae TaxID=2762277 RepID=A0A7H1NQC9_9PROT|nr:virulence factor SrfB [Entomobacter blattae]QNT77989.1 Virulence factor SrfB [Entomobacter blattae]